MENNDFNKNIAEFMKWSKTCIITSMIIALFGIGALLLLVLREFTDIEVKAPYLYSKTSALIILAIFLVLVTFEIFCYVKARKCKN